MSVVDVMNLIVICLRVAEKDRYPARDAIACSHFQGRIGGKMARISRRGRSGEKRSDELKTSILDDAADLQCGGSFSLRIPI